MPTSAEFEELMRRRRAARDAQNARRGDSVVADGFAAKIGRIGDKIADARSGSFQNRPTGEQPVGKMTPNERLGEVVSGVGDKFSSMIEAAKSFVPFNKRGPGMAGRTVDVTAGPPGRPSLPPGGKKLFPPGMERPSSLSDAVPIQPLAEGVANVGGPKPQFEPVSMERQASLVQRAATGNYKGDPNAEAPASADVRRAIASSRSPRGEPSMIAAASGGDGAPPAAKSVPTYGQSKAPVDGGTSQAIMDALADAPQAGSGRGDWRQALRTAGFAMMGGDGDAWQNISKGATAGFADYDRTKKEDEANANTNYERGVKRAEVGHRLGREGVEDGRNAKADARDERRIDIADKNSGAEADYRRASLENDRARTGIMRDTAGKKTGLDKVYELADMAAKGDKSAQAALDYGGHNRVDPAIARAAQDVLKNPMASEAEKARARRSLGMESPESDLDGLFD